MQTNVDLGRLELDSAFDNCEQGMSHPDKVCLLLVEFDCIVGQADMFESRHQVLTIE